MSILDRLATFQDPRSEAPNQALAKTLAETQDRDAIGEVAAALWQQSPAIRSDCIKVLYEVGYLAPGLIADYAEDFVKLLRSKNNRLVWGAMIALSTIAALKADALVPHTAEIQKAMEAGSVITVDAGVLTLARIAAHSQAYNQAIFPYLLNHLRYCRPKEVPQHAEKIATAVNAGNLSDFVAVIETRLESMTPTQAARLKKVIRRVQRQGQG